MNASDLDREVLDGWWSSLLATGRLPAALEVVQQRLVRIVGCGTLPSGLVHVKLMTFPRAKDRLRYCVRALPLSHEAKMLRLVAAAGIACPQVLDVRTRRRRGLPSHSWLVIRTLPVLAGPDPATPAERLRDEAELAMRLLAAGIVHRDLHGENFVRLIDGSLAVLDLQSARHFRGAVPVAAGIRQAVAARLLRERALDDGTAAGILRQVGLIHDDDDLRVVLTRVDRERRQFERSRVMRCLQESTEFTRRFHWSGSEHRRRGPIQPGHWYRGDASLVEAWIGQRALHLREGRPMLFHAFFRKWWWLGGGAALYVPAACSNQDIQAEVKAAAAGFAWLQTRLGGSDVAASGVQASDVEASDVEARCTKPR